MNILDKVKIQLKWEITIMGSHLKTIKIKFIMYELQIRMENQLITITVAKT